MNKKILLIILVVLGVVGWQGYHYLAQETEESTLTLYGNVDIRDVVLSFRVSGRINTVLYEEGDRVQQGQELATLDDDTFLEDLALVKAQLDEAKAVYRNALQTFNRRSKLVKTGAVSQSLYDDALALRDQAKARIKTAEVRIDKAETALKDTSIKAPSSGVILTRVREPGSIIQAGQPVYTLAVDDPVWVRTYVSEPDLGNLYPGQPALVYTDTRPDDPYEGQVGFISPQAEFTPKNVQTTQLRTDLVYRLRVIVDDPDLRLRQGMPVTVRIKNKETSTDDRGGDAQ